MRFEELRDPLMCLSKLASVAFIENKNHPFIFQRRHGVCVALTADGSIQLLQGCDNQLRIIRKLLDQGFGIIGALDAIFFEAVKCFDSLRV